jgi:hypothetical protein
VHRAGVPYAFIDWDTAGPRPRIRDQERVIAAARSRHDRPAAE